MNNNPGKQFGLHIHLYMSHDPIFFWQMIMMMIHHSSTGWLLHLWPGDQGFPWLSLTQIGYENTESHTQSHSFRWISSPKILWRANPPLFFFFLTKCSSRFTKKTSLSVPRPIHIQLRQCVTQANGYFLPCTLALSSSSRSSSHHIEGEPL